VEQTGMSGDFSFDEDFWVFTSIPLFVISLTCFFKHHLVGVFY
jgi:hypothetical protein